MKYFVFVSFYCKKIVAEVNKSNDPEQQLLKQIYNQSKNSKMQLLNILSILIHNYMLNFDFIGIVSSPKEGSIKMRSNGKESTKYCIGSNLKQVSLNIK